MEIKKPLDNNIIIRTTKRNLEALLGEQTLSTGHVVKAGAGVTGIVKITRNDGVYFIVNPGHLEVGKEAIEDYTKKGIIRTEYALEGETYVVILVDPMYEPNK